MGLPCSALIHFLLVEVRTVYLFYSSARSLMRKVALDAEMMEALGDADVVDYSGMKCFSNATVQLQVECAKEEIEAAMWTISFDGSNISSQCDVQPGGRSVLGMFHLASLGLSVALVGVSVLMLICSGARDFESGQYLVFTWELESKCAYKGIAGCMMLLTIGGILFTLAMAAGFLPALRLSLSPWTLMRLAGIEMLVLLASAISLLLPVEPAFNYQSLEVVEAHFNRSLLDLFRQSNDAFATKLTDAIMRARFGKPKQLRRLVPDLPAESFGCLPDSSDEDDDGDSSSLEREPLS